jgi:hypothetical protein
LFKTFKPMKSLLFILLTLCIGSKTDAQHRKDNLKHLLDSLTANKDNIGEVNATSGSSKMVYNFSTVNNKIFWIEHRDQHVAQSGDTDSVTSDAYLFINDKLVAIRIYWHTVSVEVNNVFFYFENDRLVEQDSRYKYSDQEADSFLKKGYAFLANGYKRINQ